MPGTILDVDLRPATLDDAEMVADLDSLRDPDEPRDPVHVRHWWQMTDRLERSMRRVAVRDGAALAYVSASHERWTSEPRRYGTIRASLRADMWSDAGYRQLLETAEEWLRVEGATTAVSRVREDFAREMDGLHAAGYRENRRMRMAELDLVARRDHVLRQREICRGHMRDQGVLLLALSDDRDPDKLAKLYAAMIESEKDVPTTVPWLTMSFDEWRAFWFDNPAIREDRFWIAREGDAIVGTSVLDTPVVRGIPWTAYTGTVRRVRGRGIARALKYESIGQAVEVGYTRVRTSNDADNPAILHLNQEMGYALVAPLIELHRELGP